MNPQNREETISEREEKILSFWKKNRIFEKTLAKTRSGKKFVFYEGPPTANGSPGIHHFEARAFKDVIPRYKTMRGFFVARKAGWDTHGLPVELAVEKELGLKSKREIEEYGIAKFNQKCRESVWRYKEEWDRFTRRIGFWLDIEHPYITYETSYIETLWWVIKEFWKRGLLYQDFKVLPWCPRCQTGLSFHELGQPGAYRAVEDRSVYVRFWIKSRDPRWKNTSILAWTTMPWTLPGNVALAIDAKARYARVPDAGGRGQWAIVAEARLADLAAKKVITRAASSLPPTAQTFLGKTLVGLEYEPLFAVKELVSPKAHRVYEADFVTMEEGTGVVHTAVMYGEDDYRLGKAIGLPRFHTVTETGHFIKNLDHGLGGLLVKDLATEENIIASLKRRGILAAEERYSHEYPHCWRCDTALLYYARQGWWVKMSQLKKELWKNNETIHWVPEHIKRGRFGEFIKDVRDWAFSRERFWGTPLPIWKCGACGAVEVIGSLEELKKRAKILPRDEKKQVNLHRPYVDAITFDCTTCGGSMKRVPEVADVWFDSGAMPFAQHHFPFAFAKEKKPTANSQQPTALPYPADYICEAIDQTRGWFYTLLAVATTLGKKAPYKNVISLGHLLDKNGQKMAKSRGNVVNPWDMIQKYGADTIRWYLYTINAPGDPKRFDERDVQNTLRGFVMTFWNSFLLFDTYIKKPIANRQSPIARSPLDKWIIAKVNEATKAVTEKLDEYDIVGAARLIEQFVIADFSQWYLRRSRRRLQHPRTNGEKTEAARTIGTVLLGLCRLTAPFAPFLAEAVYQELRPILGLKELSVHLLDWESGKRTVATSYGLIKDMQTVREICSEALRQRAEAGIKVRQPLDALQIANRQSPIAKDFLDLIREEVNVKRIAFGKETKLDTRITPELRREGIVREIIRIIQEMRKRAGLSPGQKIQVGIYDDSKTVEVLGAMEYGMMEETNARKIVFGPAPKTAIKQELASGGARFEIWIQRIT